MSQRSRSVLFVVVLALVAAACSANASPELSATASISSATDTDPRGVEDRQVDETGEESKEGASTDADVQDRSTDRALFDALKLPQLPSGDAPGTSSNTANSTDALEDSALEDSALEDSALEDGVAADVESLVEPATEPVVDAAVRSASCVAPVEQELTVAPPWVTNALQGAVNHPDFDGLDVSVSVWIDGWGEVITRDPDVGLVPASNEKILVAHAANELLDLESTIDTTVERVGRDLVFRAAGDPTFSTARANVLVDQVLAAGITSADRLIIDVSQFPQPPAASGWQSWQIRNFVGPLSGFMLDANRWNTSDQFFESPAQVNGEWLAERFRIAGVAVDTVEVGTAPVGREVGRVESAPVGALVRDMMLNSNNQIADMLVLQLGLLSNEGTLLNGIAQIEQELSDLCVPLDGVMDDGSGLSRLNLRSAREFQEILRAVRGSDTADVFESQLPISGVSGTLRNRFGGDAGRVLAKTGTIFGGRALSGSAATDSGRDAVFSIIINGERDATSSSLAAMDQLVRTILRS